MPLGMVMKYVGAYSFDPVQTIGLNEIRHHIPPSDPRNLLKSDYSRWKRAAQ